MKILDLTHNNINYEFRLLESSEIIEITKAGRLSYTMRRSHSGSFYCNCWGAKRHHKCWHRDGDSSIGYFGPADLIRQPAINEPWAQWAEEAGRIQYAKTTA